MTNYGTIPTSSSPNPNLEYISRAKNLIREGLGTRRPWRQMFDYHNLNFPKSFHEATTRVKYNLAYFQMNYVIAVLVVVFLSLLWHPISLIVFIVMMCAWLFLYFLRDEPLLVFERVVSDRVVMIVLGVVTFVVLMVTGATTNILSAVAVGVVLVVGHGVVRKCDDLCGDEEAGGLLRT